MTLYSPGGLNLADVTAPLILAYDDSGTKDVVFAVSATGDLTITPDGGDVEFAAAVAITLTLAVAGIATFDGGLDGEIGGVIPAAGSFTTGNFSGLLLANDKLSIAQITTTGPALLVNRNLGAASTDSEVAFFRQQNAGDDQNTVTIVQAGSGYALEVLSGSTLVKAFEATTGTFAGLLTATVGIKLGTTVTLTEASPSVLALADGDDFHMISGAMGIGTTPSPNADLVIESGSLMLRETTTPTADGSYGKIYPKADNKLYFQDGAGVEHEVSLV